MILFFVFFSFIFSLFLVFFDFVKKEKSQKTRKNHERESVFSLFLVLLIFFISWKITVLVLVFFTLFCFFTLWKNKTRWKNTNVHTKKHYHPHKKRNTWKGGSSRKDETHSLFFKKKRIFLSRDRAPRKQLDTFFFYLNVDVFFNCDCECCGSFFVFFIL